MINRKLALPVGIPVLLASLLAGVFVAYGLMSTKGALGSWQDYRDASSLLADSARVVLATYLDEVSHEIPTVTSDISDVIGSVMEIFRRFRIEESLKGEPGRTVTGTNHP